MHGAILAYTILLLTLLLVKLYPPLYFLPHLFMISPLFFISENSLGLKNYRKGLLYGSLLLPLVLIIPPKLQNLPTLLNQLGIATAEEIFFRGYLMIYFGNFTTSLLFSLAHLVNFPTVNSVLTFFPSLLFGFVYRRSGSIVAPITLHFTANMLYFSLVEKFPELYHFLQRELTRS